MKKITTLIFFVALFIISIGISEHYKLKILNINLTNWIAGYIIIFIFAYIIHWIIYRLTLKRLNILPVKNEKNLFEYLNHNKSLVILTFLSPDYIFAYIFKKILKENYDNNLCELRNKNEKYHNYKGGVFECKYINNNYECEIYEKKKKRKLYILYSNWANLIVVVFFTIVAILDSNQNFIPQNFMNLIFVSILLHALSRILEVSYAFYNDVVSTRMTHNLEIGERLSTLKRGNRISLAMHSYLEIILAFSLIYYLKPIENTGLREEYINIIFYSFSISAFNKSFENSSDTFVDFLHVLQVGVSMTLVILAIASYLGMKDNDEMSEYEKVDWKKKEYI